MYGPKHLVFQLFGRMGTSLCMDPTICIRFFPQKFQFAFRKIGETNNLIKNGSNKTKGHEKDSQNRLRSPMPEGGEP